MKNVLAAGKPRKASYYVIASMVGNVQRAVYGLRTLAEARQVEREMRSEGYANITMGWKV